MEISHATEDAHAALAKWKKMATDDEARSVDQAYLAAFAHQQLEIDGLKKSLQMVEIALKSYRVHTSGKPC